MKNARKIVFISVFILTVFTLFIITNVIFPKFKSKINSQTNAQDNTKLSTKIVSIPPNKATAGQRWSYSLSIRNFVKNKFNLKIEKPAWLNWDGKLLTLSGIVPKDIKSFTVKISLIDKDNPDKIIDSQEAVVNVETASATNNDKKLIVKLKPKTSPSIIKKSESSNGVVLGTSSTRVPDTAISPLGAILVGIGLISLGLGIRYIKTQHLSAGNPHIRVVTGKIRDF